MSWGLLRRRTRRHRRGASGAYFALALPVLGGMAALAVEYTYAMHVRVQLDGVARSAAHAAIVELSAAGGTVDSARATAIEVTEGLIVEDVPFELFPEDVEFGYLNAETGVFIPTEERPLITAARVQLRLEQVGIGFGKAFFGRWFTIETCGAVEYGGGNANTGDEGGPGLSNGHFDYDTTVIEDVCPGGLLCVDTGKHTHEFDDALDTTFSDLFSNDGNHASLDGCLTTRGRPVSCLLGGVLRTLSLDKPFVVTVVNADLSPGAFLVINGERINVADYDDIPFNELPIFSLDGSVGVMLSTLEMDFDPEAIANCQLHPTNTRDVRRNTLGINGEWRNGALTLQVVTPEALGVPALSAGAHAVVPTQFDGLVFEANWFWHWDGPSYVESQADDWLDQYNALDCPSPRVIDHVEGLQVCP